MANILASLTPDDHSTLGQYLATRLPVASYEPMTLLRRAM
jgi:hypothetical protein